MNLIRIVDADEIMDCRKGWQNVDLYRQAIFSRMTEDYKPVVSCFVLVKAFKCCKYIPSFEYPKYSLHCIARR